MSDGKKVKGVFEKEPGSGEWWIRYADESGRIRQEKAGTRSLALQLREQRKTEGRQRRKLPENLRARPAKASAGLRRKLLYAVLIFIAGMVLFSIRLNVPEGLVFDEVAYVPAANGFSTGVHLEPSHPPLGKMIIAGGILMLGDNPEGWRIASVAAGALILVLVYCLTLQLSQDILSAVAAAVFAAVNGMLFVLARTGMLDAISVMFLFAALACVAATAKGQLSSRWGGALAGCAFGLCMACKWMALIPMAACWLALWALRKRAAIPAMLAPFIAAYVLPFLALARILHVMPSWSWFWAQQAGIYGGHAGYLGDVYHASRWWTWPLKARPQIGADDFGTDAVVLLLGNPVVMWLGLGAMLALAYRSWRSRDGVAAAVCAAYIVLYGQYVVMPLKTEFYHYYLAASLCLGPALALAARTRPRLLAVLAWLAVWSFACAYPAMTLLPGGHWTGFL